MGVSLENGDGSLELVTMLMMWNSPHRPTLLRCLLFPSLSSHSHPPPATRTLPVGSRLSSGTSSCPGKGRGRQTDIIQSGPDCFLTVTACGLCLALLDDALVTTTDLRPQASVF